MPALLFLRPHSEEAPTPPRMVRLRPLPSHRQPYRIMKRNHAILAAPLFVALLGTAFCVWSALGNDVNFCVTTGCTLYQDFTVAGISLWWFGTAAFGLLAGLALLGAADWGRFLAALTVFCDLCLLLLMAFTAPCVSCLVAGLGLALVYLLFRRPSVSTGRSGGQQRRSLLLWAWLALFVVNVGAVARSQADIWPIFGDGDTAVTRLYFSPSCRYCIDGVNALSGKVDVAYYPLAETDADVYKVARLGALLDEGQSMAEALAQCQNVSVPTGFAAWRPNLLLLRFRLLRNKAHVFAAGSQGVPFFEYRGLPPHIREQAEQRERGQNGRQAARESRARAETTASGADAAPRDATLPLSGLDGANGADGAGGMSGVTNSGLAPGQCGPGQPCPPDVAGR